MWNDTARDPDILGMDARAIIPFSIWFFHWSWNTFYLALAGVLFFWFALRRGDSPANFIRKIINRIILGNRNWVDPVVYRRRTHW